MSELPPNSRPSAPDAAPGGVHPTPLPYEQHAPDTLTTLDEHGRRKWVYPAEVRGFFMRYRHWLGYFVIAVFFVMPWIRIGGMQSILLDIPQRRFVLFGAIFWPQDVFYLVFVLIGLTLALFFFTAVAGRIWCGWLCPQTVFMEEIFRRIEEWTEGNARARRRLDQAPWSAGKVTRKLAKHALFLVFSAAVSNTFISYFVGMETLLGWMTQPPTAHWTAFLFMAVILGAFYFDFAWFREQFCVVLCPYARFQAVLTDAHTVQVGYDVVRGEPRGRVGSTTGDCVSCFRCVAVCPTGIDIRDGFQMECIGCARCIDACDEIMQKVNRPQGLIRYDSLNNLTGQKTAILRPRVVIYSIALVAVIAALFWGLGTRPELSLAVLRPPGEPFNLLPDGSVTNHFTLRIQNMAQEPRSYRLAVQGPEDAHLVTPRNPLPLSAGELVRAEVFVTVPADEVKSGRANLRFSVALDAEGGPELAGQDAVFLAPERREREGEDEHEDERRR